MKNIGRALSAIMLATVIAVQSVSAQGTNFCQAGQEPHFSLGFAQLKTQLGDAMGDPSECEHANAENGDTLQRSTSGLGFYRKSTNTPTFTNGSDHWGLSPDGLLYWTGSSVDPPGTSTAPSVPPQLASASAPPVTASLVPTQAPNPLSEADIAARVGPSVVQVITDSGEGSGTKVADGILTNAHVVKDANRIEVATSDGRRAIAKILRFDANGDLALLQTDLAVPALEMEFMGQQRQGDEVLVVGYPLGLRESGGQATVTRGLISGTGTDKKTAQALIQTDAAINHGNSGGAMVNMRAKLVGIPSYGLRAEGAQGVNFAIAIDTVNAFLGMPQSAVAPPPPPAPKPTSTPMPTATPAPLPLLYGAIAYDAFTGRSGSSWNYSDLSSAQAAAISSCGRGGCVIVQWVAGPNYAALATGYGGWGTSGVQRTQADAENSALASCRRFASYCSVQASIHNGS